MILLADSDFVIPSLAVAQLRHMIYFCASKRAKTSGSDIATTGMRMSLTVK